MKLLNIINNKNKNPIYSIKSNDTTLNRVYAAKYYNGRWLFPAFPPFGDKVLKDLKTLFGDKITASVEAVDFIEKNKEENKAAIEGDIKGFTSQYTPYEHQKIGLAKIIHFPRMAIFWDPGLGKTKLICDKIMHERKSNPKLKTLILALRCNLSTWVNEMELHSGGEEEIVSLAAPNPKKRRHH